jgi:hypothetical protein
MVDRVQLREVFRGEVRLSSRKVRWSCMYDMLTKQTSCLCAYDNEAMFVNNPKWTINKITMIKLFVESDTTLCDGCHIPHLSRRDIGLLNCRAGYYGSV